MIFLEEEPKGDAYRSLLLFLGRYCDAFELVLRRKGAEPNEHAKAAIDELMQWEERRSNVTAWAGTKLGPGGGTALLARYRLTPEALKVLLKRDRLYSWCLPSLPEDLAFYSRDGSCFFSATSHEREAMLRSGAVTKEQFARGNPTLAFQWFPGSR